MYTLIVLAVLGIDAKNDLTITAHVDAIERNHYYDAQGQLTFVQWIFWHQVWHKGKWKEVAVAWRMVPKTCTTIYRHKGGWRMVFWDQSGSESGDMRSVTTHSFFETWTQEDPEVANRKEFPAKDRPGIGWRGNPRRGQ